MPNVLYKLLPVFSTYLEFCVIFFGFTDEKNGDLENLGNRVRKC